MIKRLTILSLAFCVSCATTPQQVIKGTLTRRDHSSEFGVLTYDRGTKTYTVHTDLLGPVRIKARDILRMDVQEPEVYARAHTIYSLERYAEAIGPLKAVVRRYEMLHWDVVAANCLTVCYTRTGQPEKAIETYNTHVRGRSNLVPAAFAAYLEALMDVDPAAFKREKQKLDKMNRFDRQRILDILSKKKRAR